MEILECQRKVMEMKDPLDEACRRAVGEAQQSVTWNGFLCCKRGCRRSGTAQCCLSCSWCQNLPCDALHMVCYCCWCGQLCVGQACCGMWGKALAALALWVPQGEWVHCRVQELCWWLPAFPLCCPAQVSTTFMELVGIPLN